MLNSEFWLARSDMDRRVYSKIWRLYEKRALYSCWCIYRGRPRPGEFQVRPGTTPNSTGPRPNPEPVQSRPKTQNHEYDFRLFLYASLRIWFLILRRSRHPVHVTRWRSRVTQVTSTLFLHFWFFCNYNADHMTVCDPRDLMWPIMWPHFLPNIKKL